MTSDDQSDASADELMAMLDELREKFSKRGIACAFMLSSRRARAHGFAAPRWLAFKREGDQFVVRIDGSTAQGKRDAEQSLVILSKTQEVCFNAYASCLVIFRQLEEALTEHVQKPKGQC